MTNQDKVIRLIEKAGLNGKEAFEQGLEIYTRGHVVSGIIETVVGACLLILAVVISRALWRTKELTEEAVVALGITMLPSLIFGIYCLCSGLMSLCAPEYMALKELLRSLR